LLKVLKGVLYQPWKLNQTALAFVETSMQTYRLLEEGFGYNYGRLKSSASHASRDNSFIRCGKIPKCPRCLHWHRWAWLIRLGGWRSVACVYVYNSHSSSAAAGCLHDFKHIAYISRKS